MRRLTRSIAALVLASTFTTFGDTKEVVCSSDGSFGNDLAIGYTDARLYKEDSDLLTAVHFCC